jgi:hypothetical protein
MIFKHNTNVNNNELIKWQCWSSPVLSLQKKKVLLLSSVINKIWLLTTQKTVQAMEKWWESTQTLTLGESPFSFKFSYCKIICRESNSNSEASLLTIHYDQAPTYQYRNVFHTKFVLTFKLSYNTIFCKPNTNSSVLWSAVSWVPII